VHRLRDLDRRQALVAIALVAALLAPFGASLWRAADVGWLPSGDDALIGLRARDALGPDRALIGQPSTTHLYSDDLDTHHPGPIEFTWLALPVRALGPSAGMLVGIAVVNVASVLLALWVMLRRAGPGVAAWSAVVASGVLWSQGTALLSDPISSSAGTIPLLALAVVAWALADGDVRLLPVGALVASWVLQQHLAAVLPAAALAAFGTVGLAVHAVGRRRRRGRPPAGEGTADHDALEGAVDGRRWWPWVLGAMAIVLATWSPVLWQQATGDPGNLSAVVEYAQTSDTPSIGPVAALRQAARALGFPPLLVQWDVQGDDLFNGPLAWYDGLTAALAYGALIALAITQLRRRRTLALLALTTLVLALGGMAAGTSIPDSVEAFRANFYRWTWVVAFLGTTALGWAGALALRRFVAVPSAIVRLAPALAVVVVLVPAVAAWTTEGFDDERRDQNGFAAMAEVSDAAIERAEAAGATRVTLVPRGRSGVLATASAMALQLEDAGFEVRVPPELEARFWGEHRILQPGEDPGLILHLVTARGPVPEGPGEVLAEVSLNPGLTEVLTPLVDAARGAEVVPSDAADELLSGLAADQAEFAPLAIATLGDDPEPVLTSFELLDLLIDGYLAEPTLDPDALVELRSLLPVVDVNLDDEFELREVDRATLAELVPSWAER
jgi:hypothetical protein